MIDDRDSDYHTVRARQELVAASESEHPLVRQAHQQLSALHRQRAEDVASFGNEAPPAAIE